jgi:hypothetical protein
MAMQQISSKTQRGRSRSSSKRKPRTRSAGQVYGVAVPEGLHEAIEIERGNLSKVESVLGCLVISMESETDPVTGPHYPDVAEIARDMVRKSINGLDSLVLQQRLLRNKIREVWIPLCVGSYVSLDQLMRDPLR